VKVSNGVIERIGAVDKQPVDGRIAVRSGVIATGG
jgi:hypothetical protein